MKRLVPILILCLLLAGCSVQGPGHDGAIYFGFGPDDDFLDYIWKPLANLGLTIGYAVYVTAYALAYSGTCWCR